MTSLIFFDMALMSCVQNNLLLHSTDLPAANIIRCRMIGCLVDNTSARIRNYMSIILFQVVSLYISDKSEENHDISQS